MNDALLARNNDGANQAEEAGFESEKNQKYLLAPVIRFNPVVNGEQIFPLRRTCCGVLIWQCITC
jgi:hypothetical protein